MSEAIERNHGGVPVRPLGKTGLKVSILGIGGGHIARKYISEQETVRLYHLALDEGLTFFDNAWDYHDGESERRAGLVIKERRDEITVMTKVCGRDRETAEAHLHDSLRRLQTDVIDVWQFHEINYDNDAEWVFASDGAIEAAVAAQKAGKVRFIGFTGHKLPALLQTMLDRDFDWDTCQLPINVMDAHYRSFQHEILPELVRREIGVIGMKSLGGSGQLITEAGLSPEVCRRYSLSQSISTLVCGIESEENLRQDLEIARNFLPLTMTEQQALGNQVKREASDGRYEWFKSTQYFDGPYHRDQHGFPPIGHVGQPPDTSDKS